MATLRLTLIGVSLVAGLLGAATAYAPPVGPALAGLSLTADAGSRADSHGARKPIVRKGDVLTTAQLAELGDSGVARVLVREFALERWTGRWWFAGGVVGLVAATIWRRWTLNNGRRRGEPTDGAHAQADALRVADEIVLALDGLLASTPALADYRERLAGIQRNSIPALLEAISSGAVRAAGGRGPVELRAAVSAFERLINRGWSAAADGALEEARAAAAQARGRVEALRTCLGAPALAASQIPRPR